MVHKILLQIGIAGFTGSLVVLPAMAVAQSSAPIPFPMPAVSNGAPPGGGSPPPLPAFPGAPGRPTTPPHAVFPGAAMPPPAVPFAPALHGRTAAPGNSATFHPPTRPSMAAFPPAPVAATTTNTAPVAASSPIAANTQAENSDLLVTPLHLSTTSLLFPKSDIDVLGQLLDLYDSATGSTPKQAAAPAPGDDLNSLLKELTVKKGSENQNSSAAAIAMLPNVYLASIVYYSPRQWSVWINDKKLVDIQNVPGNEFYVSRISRMQLELVWKPPSLLDTAAKWKERTGGGKNPLPGILVNESKGTITLTMRPGQTFLPRSLAIVEGLIKSVHTAAAAATAPAGAATH